jgi:membrane protein implicated in regulation of membrane protease activity
MDNLLLWVWIVLAVLFIVAEVFTTSFFLVCFGLGAAAAAVLAYANVDFLGQMLGFLAVSGVSLFFIRPLARHLNRGDENFVTGDRLLGKKAIVLADINPALGTGTVRAETEQWSAVSADGQAIPKDTMVEVLRVDGVRLVVKPSPGTLAEPPATN